MTDPSFSKVGTEEFLGAKWSVWVFLVFFAITAFLLARTAFGRYVYAVGGNDEAARLSGVRVGLVRGVCYALSGLASGIAGVLAASRTSSAQPDLGAGLELTAIAAAVVGGVSIIGGEGAVWRGVLGVLTLAIIGNGFDLLGDRHDLPDARAGRAHPARGRRRPAAAPPVAMASSTPTTGQEHQT